MEVVLLAVHHHGVASVVASLGTETGSASPREACPAPGSLGQLYRQALRSPAPPGCPGGQEGETPSLLGRGSLVPWLPLMRVWGSRAWPGRRVQEAGWPHAQGGLGLTLRGGRLRAAPEASTGSEPCLPAHDSLWGSSCDAGMVWGAQIQAPLPHSLDPGVQRAGRQHSLSRTGSQRAAAGPPLGLRLPSGSKEGKKPSWGPLGGGGEPASSPGLGTRGQGRPQHGALESVSRARGGDASWLLPRLGGLGAPPAPPAAKALMYLWGTPMAGPLPPTPRCPPGWQRRRWPLAVRVPAPMPLRTQQRDESRMHMVAPCLARPGRTRAVSSPGAPTPPISPTEMAQAGGGEIRPWTSLHTWANLRRAARARPPLNAPFPASVPAAPRRPCRHRVVRVSRACVEACLE